MTKKKIHVMREQIKEHIKNYETHTVIKKQK